MNKLILVGPTNRDQWILSSPGWTYQPGRTYQPGLNTLASALRSYLSLSLSLSLSLISSSPLHLLRATSFFLPPPSIPQLKSSLPIGY